MKKSMILCVLLFAIMVSCNKNIEETKNEDIDATVINGTETVDSLTILFPIYSSSNPDVKDWESYLEREHGIKLSIEYINKFGPKYIFKNNLEGILYLNPGEEYLYNQYVYDMIENYDAYDLTNYYSQFGWNEFIDDSYISPLLFGNEIKAVPAVSEKNVLPRYYNKEVIEATKSSVPVTIDEFTEYLVKAQQLDDSYYPMFVSAFAVTRSTSDIFRAFDVYVSTYAESTIAFNPKTGSIEDGVFSDNFETVLLYFDMLKQRKLLKLTDRQGEIYDRKPIYYKLATEYNFIYEQGSIDLTLLPKYEALKGYYLEGINREKLVIANRELSYYIFPKTIRNIDATMTLFDSIMTDSDYFNDLKYGVKGKDYQKNASGTVIMERRTDIWQIKPYNEVMTEEVKVWDTYQSSLIYETNTNLNVLTLKMGFPDNKAEDLLRFISPVSTTESMNLFYSDSSVRDSIDEYKKQFRKYDMIEFIETVNDKLGFKTSFVY